MRVELYSLQRLHEPISEDLGSALLGVLESGRFILGEHVERFEEAFAEYCGARHCVGVGNGLDALFLALRVLEIGPGDKVIVPDNAFIAVALAVSRTGATPVFADVCPETRNIDPDRLEEALETGTRAIIVVHQYGFLADMERIGGFAREHGIFVVEDASQAHGASHGTRTAGSFGDIACFSFYPSKNLGALGDAGCLLTNNEEHARRARRLRNYGLQRRRLSVDKGFNSRLDEIQAACLNVKLAYLDGWNRRRNEIAQCYAEQLSDVPEIQLPKPSSDGACAWHLFVICHPQRDALSAELNDMGIETAIHYPQVIHQTPMYKAITPRNRELRVSETLASTCLSLPIAPYLETEEVACVVSGVKTAVKNCGKPSRK